MPAQKNNNPDFFDENFLERLSSLIRNDRDDFVRLTEIANLNPRADFRDQHIFGIDFGISNLIAFNFSGSFIENCNLSGATIRSSNFKDSYVSGTKLSRTQYDSIKLRAKSLTDIQIVGEEYSLILHQILQNIDQDKRFLSIGTDQKVSMIRNFVEETIVNRKLRHSLNEASEKYVFELFIDYYREASRAWEPKKPIKTLAKASPSFKKRYSL